MSQIRFNRPFIIGRELEYIQQAIEQMHISGDGSFTKKCQAFFEKEFGVPKVLLTTSCTHALEMAALLLNIRPGDEVIVPSFTFVSTVNAFVLHGARPVFIDIRPDTLNLDEMQLEQLITPQTKAILPISYAGVGCEMDTIQSIAKSHKVEIVEDNAHGLFGKYNDKYLGTFGCLSTQSFHETKNFSCGEGGALFINNPNYIERAQIIWDKGTNRSNFLRGEIDRYTWIDIGSSYLPSDMLAAFLYAQLEVRNQIQSNRKRIWKYYKNSLRKWAHHQEVQLPYVPQSCEPAYHNFYLILPSQKDRENLISHLTKTNIQASFHYLPLHLSEMGKRFGGEKKGCPISENISDRLIRLPFYSGMVEPDQARVVSEIQKWKKQ